MASRRSDWFTWFTISQGVLSEHVLIEWFHLLLQNNMPDLARDSPERDVPPGAAPSVSTEMVSEISPS